MMDDSHLANYTLEQGGVYNLLVARDPETNKVAARLYTLTSPNSIHILWQFPQYFVITSSEVMFSVTGEMKSVIYEQKETHFLLRIGVLLQPGPDQYEVSSPGFLAPDCGVWKHNRHLSS